MRSQRFQNRVTAGRFTLPAAILISVACWILSAILLPDLEIRKGNYPLWDIFYSSCIPTWGTRLFSFILYSVIGYFLKMCIRDSIKATDFPALKAFALEHKIDMIVVGPEDPLVQGIFDFFKEDAATRHIAVIGPSAKGAQLEGSKEFAKEFMLRHHIPTARYKSVTAATLEEGLAFLETLTAPYVLKADGPVSYTHLAYEAIYGQCM